MEESNQERFGEGFVEASINLSRKQLLFLHRAMNNKTRTRQSVQSPVHHVCLEISD